MDWRPIQGVFPPCTQCSWDRLRVYLDSDQDKAIIEDKWIKWTSDVHFSVLSRLIWFKPKTIMDFIANCWVACFLPFQKADKILPSISPWMAWIASVCQWNSMGLSTLVSGRCSKSCMLKFSREAYFIFHIVILQYNVAHIFSKLLLLQKKIYFTVWLHWHSWRVKRAASCIYLPFKQTYKYKRPVHHFIQYMN